MARPPALIDDPGHPPVEPRRRRQRSAVFAWAGPVVLWGLLWAGTSRAAPPPRDCKSWHAEVIAVEGVVEVLRQSQWQKLPTGAVLCMGETVRTEAFGRATVQLPDKTAFTIAPNSTLTLTEPEDDQDRDGTWIDLIKGALHVISRHPHGLRINTPYVNAGIEGTEFVVTVDDHQANVTVVEGKVKLRNPAGEVAVPSGERGSATMSSAPLSVPVADPIDALRWTPYFVPLLGENLPRPGQEPTRAQARSAEFFAHRAASRFQAGQIEEARGDLSRALGIDASNPHALALETLVALSGGRETEALNRAQQAVNAASADPVPRLALSYAAEANGNVPAALAAAGEAARLAPGNALAWARLGEMRLAAGDFGRARAAAEMALALDPRSAYAYTVLGFARLQGEGALPAAADFRKAIARDPAAPLPRLGLGLALTRSGKLELGREEIELGVMLDPTNSLSRSYMAKIYDAELREKLSEAQLAIAKHLNGTDPTPWLYDALRKQSANRPIDALHDLQGAIERNDNRAVYRSRLLVDEDLAARSAGIGQIHRTLGFERLAMLEGWRSLAANPTDFSSHRLLADVYSSLPRHESARVDELYQSELMQPLNLTAVLPQLGEPNLFVVDTLGPGTQSFDEFHPLVEQNGLSYEASAVGASEGTRGVDAAIAGLGDKLSFSVGWFNYRTDGFRANNDFDQTVANALVQFRPVHGTSIYTELRSSRVTKGDTELLFDPAFFNPLERQTETVDTARLGVHRELSERGTLLGTFILESANGDNRVGPYFDSHGSRDGGILEVQHSYRGDRWKLISGGRLERFDHADRTSAAIPPTMMFATMESERRVEGSSAYLYGNVDLAPGLSATIGGSYDRVVGVNATRSSFDPKLGLTWQPAAHTTLRVVRFKTLQGPFWSKQSAQPSLEPTQVAGFNQRFFGPEAQEAWRDGAAIDHAFSADLYVGGELSRRHLATQFYLPGTEELIASKVDTNETLGRSYVYWTPSSRLALGSGYEYEHINNNGSVLAEGFSDLQTRRLPVTIKYFLGHGLSWGAKATWVAQSGDFDPGAYGPDEATTRGESRFWTLDLSMGYRLPNRRGLVSLTVNNAMDKSFRFQDTDPENPRIVPQRMLLLRVSLAY